MPIDREELRSCLLEALRRNPQTQYENLKYSTGDVAAERGLAVRVGGSYPRMLDRPDWRTLREMIWRLIADGVLVVGMDDSNESWPFLSLTDYGERYVKDQRATPHDRTSFMSRLTKSGPLDEVEQVYVSEALEAFARDLPNSAALMVGAASEHALILLVNDIAARDPTAAASASAALREPALRVLRFAEKYIRDRKEKLARQLSEQLDTTFMGIANLIRMTRNDAGHPALPAVDRERCFVALTLYPDYRAWVIEVRSLLPL